MDLQEILTNVAKAIVDTPDAVKVSKEETDTAIVLTLSVAEKDMGMVIGKHGKIAKAIRTIIKAASAGNGKKVSVDIVE